MDFKKIKTARFAPPEGDFRQIVKDYMLSMFNIDWTPSEDIPLTWKGESKFSIKLKYEKGKTYRGLPYSDTKCTLSEFEHFVHDGVFDVNSIYYEEMIGNNCGSSMANSFQQLVDLPFGGRLKPSTNRGKMLDFPGGLKLPTEFGVKYDANDLWNANAKNDIFESYAKCDTGDILYFSIKTGSGHARLVSLPAHVERFENGIIDPENSYITTIEQTNQFDKTRTDDVMTTWWIDHRYTFNMLYEKRFMPVTLSVYTSGEKLTDAYIFYDGDNTPESVVNGFSGNVTTTFPLTYVRVSVETKDGKEIRRSARYGYFKEYHIDISTMNDELEIKTLPKGEYVFKVTSGIARGDAVMEKVNFEIL